MTWKKKEDKGKKKKIREKNINDLEKEWTLLVKVLVATSQSDI